MKKFKNLFIIIILLYIILQMFLNISMIHSIIIFSYKIFIYNVIPNIFPFLIISRLLINYGFVELASKLFNPIFNKLFKVNGTCSFIFIMSLLTGFPSSSKYTTDLLNENKIGPKTATKILMFTHFSNPLFVIGTISSLINYKTALIILFAHYLGNIIIGLIFRNYYIENSNVILNERAKSFGITLVDSIKSAFDTLLLIFGTMTFFLIISNIICNTINLPPFYSAILSGILELTQGIKYISLIDLSIKLKAAIIGIFISFGGISVHAQILSIIANTSIKYKPFLVARIIHSFATGLIIYFII